MNSLSESETNLHKGSVVYLFSIAENLLRVGAAFVQMIQIYVDIE